MPFLLLCAGQDVSIIVPANKYVSTFVNIIRFTPLKFPPNRGDAEGRGVLFY